MDKRRHGSLGRAFTRLWAATAASNLGDGLVLALLPLIALEMSAKPAAVAGVTVATTAAWPLFGLPGGLLVDSFNRRGVLITVNAVRAAVLSLLAVAWATEQVNLPMLYVTALVLGAGETFADTALTSMVPAVVPPELRGAANARIETTINVLNQLVGPPAAGILISVGVALASGVTAGTYALALVGLVLLPLRSDASSSKAPRANWWKETTAGMRTLWGDRLLRRLTLMTAAMNLAWAAWSAVFVLYAVAPGPLGLTPAGYGVLLAGMAVGGLAAATVVNPLAGRLGVRTMLVLDLLGTVALVAPGALGLGLLPVAVGAVVAGAGSTVWRTIVATIRHNRVADHLLGRVYASSRIISWGVLPVGAAISGALSQARSVRFALGTASAVALILVLAFPVLMRGHDLDSAYRHQQ